MNTHFETGVEQGDEPMSLNAMALQLGLTTQQRKLLEAAQNQAGPGASELAIFQAFTELHEQDRDARFRRHREDAPKIVLHYALDGGVTDLIVNIQADKYGGRYQPGDLELLYFHEGRLVDSNREFYRCMGMRLVAEFLASKPNDDDLSGGPR